MQTRNKTRLFVSSLALCLGLAAQVTYAQPANNNFAAATVVGSAGGHVSGNNTGGTQEAGEPTVSFPGDEANAGLNSIWWSWTPTQSGATRISTAAVDANAAPGGAGNSAIDTELGVYTGTAVNALSPVIADMGASGGEDFTDTNGSQGGLSRVNFNAVAGTTYRIRVAGWQQQVGAIELYISQASGAGFTLTTNVAGTGAGTVAASPAPDGTGKYAASTVVTLTATASAGSGFQGWTGADTVAGTSATVTMNSDRTVTATFTNTATGGTNYTITATSNSAADGTVTGGGTYASGATVTLTATPLAGHVFTSWTEGGTVVSAANPYSFTASADRTLVGNFIPTTNTVTITTMPSDGARGSTAPASTNVLVASTVTVVATANPGFTFANWTDGESVVSTTASYTFTATDNRNLIANFVPVGVVPTGVPGLLFQHSSGVPAVWYLDGTTFISSSFLTNAPNPGPDWTIVGVGRFDTDDSGDILFQHSSGVLAIWNMSGATFLSAQYLTAPNPGPSWKAVGVGDFNGDGQNDILFQHSSGVPAVWYMSGTTFVSGTYLNGGGNPGPTWRIAGVGDFNGDGQNDIVFQHSSGVAAVWYMTGITFGSGAYITGAANPGPNWRIGAVDDINGDGQSDLVFQYTDGTPAVWLMGGSTVTSSTYFTGGRSPGAAWRLVGPR